MSQCCNFALSCDKKIITIVHAHNNIRVLLHANANALRLCKLLKSDWPVIMPSVKLLWFHNCCYFPPWSFFLKLIWKIFTAVHEAVCGCRVLDFSCHVSSVAARHSVIDYPTSTLLWIYCQRHSLWLNDNHSDKQLKSGFAARMQDVRRQWQRRLVLVNGHVWNSQKGLHTFHLLHLFITFYVETGNKELAMQPDNSGYVSCILQHLILFFLA